MPGWKTLTSDQRTQNCAASQPVSLSAKAQRSIYEHFNFPYEGRKPEGARLHPETQLWKTVTWMEENLQIVHVAVN